jgi:hypothetical protein
VSLTEPLPGLCWHLWPLNGATNQDELEPTSSSIRAASEIAAFRSVRNLKKHFLNEIIMLEGKMKTGK